MNMLHKMTSKRGETLAETLVSILLVGLAMMFLAHAITTSGKLTDQARDEDKVFEEELMAAEACQNELSDSSLSVKVENVSTGSQTVITDNAADVLKITFYGKDENTLLRSYKISE